MSMHLVIDLDEDRRASKPQLNRHARGLTIDQIQLHHLRDLKSIRLARSIKLVDGERTRFLKIADEEVP